MSPTHAPAGVPRLDGHTSPIRQGGPLISFSQPTLTIPGRARRERAAHSTVSRTAESTRTADSGHTAESARTAGSALAPVVATWPRVWDTATAPIRQEGTLAPFSLSALTIPDQARHERTAHNPVSHTAERTRAADSARTTEPARQEVDR